MLPNDAVSHSPIRRTAITMLGVWVADLIKLLDQSGTHKLEQYPGERKVVFKALFSIKFHGSKLTVTAITIVLE